MTLSMRHMLKLWIMLTIIHFLLSPSSMMDLIENDGLRTKILFIISNLVEIMKGLFGNSLG